MIPIRVNVSKPESSDDSVESSVKGFTPSLGSLSKQPGQLMSSSNLPSGDTRGHMSAWDVAFSTKTPGQLGWQSDSFQSGLPQLSPNPSLSVSYHWVGSKMNISGPYPERIHLTFCPKSIGIGISIPVKVWTTEPVYG